MRPQLIAAALLIPLLGILLASQAVAAPSLPVRSARSAQPVLNGQHTLIQNPRQMTDRVVLYVHGAGETAGDSLTRPRNKMLVDRLLEDGYTVATTDARGDNWGSERSLQDYMGLVRHLRALGLTRVYILAQSMGGMDGLQLISRLHPVAWAGIFPACNLRSVSTIERLIPGVRAAHPYGLPRSLSPVRPSHVSGLPMLFWASYGDTVVPRALNTDVCAHNARQAGAEVQVITTTGDHGNLSNYQPGRLLRFFATSAGPGAERSR